MAIPRVVYFAQSGQLTSSTAPLYTVPISSANLEVSRPIEGVNTFGHFGSLNTAQTNLTTCKSTLKGYLGSGNSISGFTAAVLNDILNNTASGLGITLSVLPGGFQLSGICTNIGIDIAMGGFGMIDLGLAGIGEPLVLVNPLTGGSQTTIPTNTFSLAPITTMSILAGNTDANTQFSGVNQAGVEVSGYNALSGTYATSIKFTYDLPTDVLGSLGDNPDATQGSSQIVSQMATKPPYKATISVEGHGVNPTLNDASVAGLFYVIGNIGIQLPHAKVSARSASNAAGQVSETFSYTIEDFSANIIDTSYLLNPYGQGAAATLPAYGG